MTTAPLGPGEQIAGRYTIESAIGEGGMGTVFAATQAFTGRRVAVKVLHDHWASDETAVQRFVQEARIVAQLSHPSIAQVLDGGVDPQHGVFVVMERLEGRTLQQWLDEKQRVELEDVRRWLVPVMHALAVAHSSDVLHRDVKPDNIFLARQGDGSTVAKLLDFGMSKLTAGREALVKTHTGAVLGTPWYMSPEQTRGDVLDSRADVWSMGVVLYQCLSGDLPFAGNTLPAVIAGIMTREPTPLRSLREDLPQPLCDVVMRALQKDREARVPSMRALADEVARAVRTAQNSVAFAQTVPHGADVSQQIQAALAKVNSTPPPPGPSQTEQPQPVVPPSTIAIPAVVLKRVTAEAAAMPLPNANPTQTAQTTPPPRSTVELDAPIDTRKTAELDASNKPRESAPVAPIESISPILIVVVTAVVVAGVAIAVILLLKR
ncbi:MAG: protein kinase [Myxococcales bacterium]|nr:protein kinase [Myxococcales bacterium]